MTAPPGKSLHVNLNKKSLCSGIVTYNRIGIMRDWLVRSKENSEE